MVMGTCASSGTRNAREQIFAVEHTAAAMDNQIVGGEIVRKIRAAHHLNVHILSILFAKKIGNLHTPDILTQRGMGTRFRDEHMGLGCSADSTACAPRT